MTTMNISLPEALKSFIDARVEAGGYSTSSEYLRELIRKDLQRHQMRDMILEGMNSPDAGVLDEAAFKRLRSYAKKAAKK